MDINYRQIADDFRQRFLGTFVHIKFKADMKPELFILRDVQDGDAEPWLTFVNKKSGTVKLSYTTECEITFPFPKVGYFNHDSYAVLFQRLPARRYKRGICSENSVMEIPYKAFYPINVAINEETLTEAFNVSYAPLYNAVDALDKGEIASVALSNTLAIGLSPSTKVKEYVIWFLAKPIATYSRGIIRIRETQFTQEVVDYIKKSNSNAQVI